MYVVHGAWIPEAEDTYQRGGAFYLWVEGLAGRTGKEQNSHPRALKAAPLADFLKQELGLKSYDDKQFQRQVKECSLTLPTADGGPVKCYELLRYTGEEPPDGFTFQPWQVCAYPVPTRDLLEFLTDLHVLFAGRPSTVLPGNDLHFWYLFSQIVKTIVLKDQYIPAVRYQELAAPKKSKDVHYKLHPTWEIISAQYEARVNEYADLMPPVCAAAAQVADASATLFQREALLRHFTENLLHSIIHNTPMTGQFDKQIAETLLENCVYPSGTWKRKIPEPSLKIYGLWAAWRNGLAAQHVSMPFHLGFQLQDAQTEHDPWLLHFIIAAKDDPSLRLTLNDYWYLDATTRKQVQKVFGKDADKHILLSLGQAARMYPKIWDGLETDKPTAVALDMDETLTFLKEYAWILEDAGFKVIIPSWWTPQGMRRAKLRVKTSVKGTKKASAATSTSLLNLDALIQYRYDLAIGGETVSPAEWQQLVNAKAPLVKFRGAWMELDAAKMRAMFEFWERQADQPQETTMLDFLAMTADEELDFEHDADIQDILARLQEPGQFELLPDPPKFQGKLRDYQKRGVSWLAYLEGLGLNGCLADDMGLGKTIEVIARLIHEREGNPDTPPTLLIAPTSVLGNWKKEIERFAPHLNAMIHHGSNRLDDEAAFQAECQKNDVVISSYALARRDEKLLQAVDWQRIVLDEAQNIKNPQAAQTKAILKLKARHRLTLTGTPVENRLLDLWSLFNFLNRDYLGTQTHFRKTFESPIQRENDRLKTQVLKKLTTPFILRRVKTDPEIIKDLPDKVEQKVYCNLSTEQASLYEAVVKDVAEQIERKEGMERKGLMLATLMKLKQICNHPAQFLQDGSAFTPERSQKLNRLQDMLEEVMENNESLLIFSQFKEICSSLSEFTSKTLHYPTYLLHGGVSRPKRQQMIEAFQDPESDPAIFILSLKAGGVGLNLTKANHVFHFDRWWNPAVENQATDRAFRIGQTKNVFVHKFIALGTLEEKIDQMIEDKKQLADSVVGADEAWLTELDNDAFKELIALNRSAVLE